MASRTKLSEGAIGTFLERHPGWERAGEALVRTYELDSYGEGIAFVVKLGFAAEARDHHPDLQVGWRRVKVAWSTHDAGGITELDTEMAVLTDHLAR